MNLLAIDPGFTQSAFVVYDGRRPLVWGKWENDVLLRDIQVGKATHTPHCAIELIGHYGTGMAVGKEIFETCIWTGRLLQAWWDRQGGNKFGLHFPSLVSRPTVKAHVCGSARAKDGNVRQALIDRWGGESIAIGGRKCQKCKGRGHTGRIKDRVTCDCHDGLETPKGPLHGLTADCWQALALAVCWWDTNKSKLEVA